MTATAIDPANLPTIDPSEIPLIAVDGEDDWRARMDDLREKYPAFRIAGDTSVWFTRIDAAREIFADARLFWDPSWTVAYGGESLIEGMSRDITSVDVPADAKEQIRLRQAVMPHFSPKYVRAWEPRMHEVCQELIGRFVDKGEADFVTDFAQYYFPYLGAQWMGAPKEDWDQLVQWEHEVFLVPEQDYGDGFYHMDNDAMRALMAYLRDLIEQKRKRPDDSYISFLLQEATIGGKPLTPEQVRGSVVIAALGSGHTVTAHLTYVFRYLADHPEARRLAQSGHDAIHDLCEELIRWYSMGGHMRQVVLDTDFHGVSLRRGDRVAVMYWLVNKDPGCPGFDQLDLTRHPNPHLSFNYGPRRCIGMHWARAARTIAIEEWHHQIPEYHIKSDSRLVEQVYAGMSYHNLPLVWP